VRSAHVQHTLSPRFTDVRPDSTGARGVGRGDPSTLNCTVPDANAGDTHGPLRPAYGEIAEMTEARHLDG
jgi:hypothetical protein